MGKFLIQGNCQLIGEVNISGAKNAALPILFATLLSEGNVNLTNIPVLKDISTTLEVLKELGARASQTEHSVHVNAEKVNNYTASYELVSSMRASILALGPLVARFGEADISLPGGCAIGARPVNLHITGLEKMGATITVENGFIKARVDGRLKGCVLDMDMVSVTGTANLMMAAALAEGITTIKQAAKEPEVVDLALFINAMGGKVTGMGTDTIVIEGVESLADCHYKVLPDRIETGTFLIAGAVSGGKVKCVNTDPKLLGAVLAKLEEANVLVTTGEDWIEVDMIGRTLKSVDITTEPHPEFPTDMQAQFTVLNTVAVGTGVITENIFENRFMHVPELVRMGANITLNGNVATCGDNDKLCGATVMATDLRASASLVIAGLIATGETVVDEIYHIDRGYEAIEDKLIPLGAKMKRVES
ncbi:MAG TPA: UDP-N-acetylglucosamine 1-carboxyvinyltransferase [Psychromonas hadalis]|nr:UDP-N-acetylglucosamine 1-carboxyvinyltransferase [Psychromonas hadalis]